MIKALPIEHFIEKYVKDEPLTYAEIGSAIRKYIYMNYEPTIKDKLQMYESLLYTIAELLDGKQPEQVQLMLTNIRNWAYARKDSVEEEDAYEKMAIENETFYNLLKIR